MSTAIAKVVKRRKPQQTSLADVGLVADDLRRTLARELHDRVAQTLSTMLIDLELFKAEQHGRQSVLRQMDALQQSTREVLSSLREVLYDLRGDETEIGNNFADALKMLVDRVSSRSSTQTKLVVSDGWPKRVKSPAALNVYRIIEECLTNARQHSGATEANVVLADTVDQFIVVVTDNGRGIDLNESAPLGMGMLGMRERALFLGADLKVTSYGGSGTTLTLNIPRRTLA